MKRWTARLKEELIVLLGYSIGIFLEAGFNPQGDPSSPFLSFENFIKVTIPDPYVLATFALFLILLLALSVRKAYAIGGPAGIIATAMGFLAGLATYTDLMVGPGMLLLAVLSAYVSVKGWRALERPPV
jgi:hypothetical protein